jgi:hypothetical protein
MGADGAMTTQAPRRDVANTPRIAKAAAIPAGQGLNDRGT